MTDSDANEQADSSPDDEGTERSPDQAGTDAAAQIASYRKRQAGAEAARQAAERKLADAEKELAKYRVEHQTASEKDLSELATLKERLAAAEKRAEEAETASTARYLDKAYPHARKELPEVTDEVRLAKFEAMLADDEEAEEPPTPRSNGGARPAKGTAKKPTIADLEAQILATPVPWGRTQ